MAKTRTSKNRDRSANRIGVYIEEDQITVVRTAKGFVKKYETLPRKQPDELSEVLKLALGGFDISSADDQIWAATDSQGGLVRNQRFPKGPLSALGPAVKISLKKESKVPTKEMLVDYDIEGEEQNDGHTQLCVTAFAEPLAHVEAMVDVFRKAGYPLDGLTLPYFGSLNFVRAGRVKPDTGRAVFVAIGRQLSVIALMDAEGLRTSRQVYIGNDTFEEQVRSHHDGALTSEQIWDFISGHAPLPGLTDGMEDLPEKVLGPPLRRLIRQVESTIQAVSMPGDLSGAELIIGGKVAHCPGLMAYIQQKSGMQPHPFTIIDRSVVGKDVEPPDAFEGCRYLTATGLCIGDVEQTPNLLFPKSVQEQRRKDRRFHVILALGTVACLVGLVVGAGLLSSHVKKLKREALGLRSTLASLPREAEAQELSSLAGQVVASLAEAGDVVNRNLSVALIGELARVGTDAVRLTELHMNMSLPEALGGFETTKRNRAERDIVTMKGRVHAVPDLQGTKLAEYLVMLEESIFFENAQLILTKKTLFGTEEVLEFHVKARISRLRKPKLVEAGA